MTFSSKTGTRDSAQWSFWIDVGGTFTDCLACSPSGSEHCVKVLSSGHSKGSIEGWNSARKFFSSFLVGDVGKDFWVGATVRLISTRGDVLFESKVTLFDHVSGYLTLSDDVDDAIQKQAVNYELDHGVHSPILAIRNVLSLSPALPIPPCQVHLGTTRGTNALLTRTGAKTAFVTTKGFRDLLAIGDQARPHLFELAIRKPQLLFDKAIEVEERILADGTIERSLDVNSATKQFERLRDEGFQSIAICLMHGYKHTSHEQELGKIASKLGFDDVRMSHEVAPLIKIVPRGETCVLDAYLNPVIGNYLSEIQDSLGSGSQLRLMTSAGGLVSANRFTGKDSVLSGPAGGVVGAARIAEQIGFKNMIGFDMGGTSTDVSRYEGHFEREFESSKAGVRIVTPMMAVETVAAGGGSVCYFDGSKLAVGPQSAGADPGPACYGRGGPLSLTDINLFLGRIDDTYFPFPLDHKTVQERLEDLCVELNAKGHAYKPLQLAQGFLKIANGNMSGALRSVSVAKGYDPKQYLLVSFGGAGSQHCCAVARNLEMNQILDHPQSSILSAVGIRLADQSSHAVAAILKPFNESRATIESVFKDLISETVEDLVTDGNLKSQITSTRSLELRYVGTDSAILIREPVDGDYPAEFSRQHQRQFGYLQERPVEIVSARVESCAAGPRLPQLEMPTERTLVSSSELRGFWWNGEMMQAGSFDRDSLKEGNLVAGPAVIANELSTTIIDPGWQALALAEGQLLIEMIETQNEKASHKETGSVTKADPVQLEIFNNHFSAIAKQMGYSLQRTSISVNVKERLDFSCAVFTKTGDLVVNAPHIPVHLGAMSETVREIIRMNPEVKANDAFVTNDPYAGGSHLPDVTVITPVFDNEELLFWVASRSHHAEMGGKAPGSMPAYADRLGEEGVLIQNFKLINAGVERFDELLEILNAPPFPSRNPAENMADIVAQIAANRCGQQDLLELVKRYTSDTVQQYMGFMQVAAEDKVRNALGKLPDGDFHFDDAMDNGLQIKVVLEKRGSNLKIDFTGTDPVRGGNLNANRAIVSAAIMYVMRCLIADDIPLNEGVMKPVELVLPECFLNPKSAADPNDSPAMVGGNVETSQRVVDTLLGALNLAAASQGTMNNWLMGDKTFGYYETVGGGSGATATLNGASAVHTHMTNTRLTDPEILETRYPAILRDFSIRAGSGGQGRLKGGDGMVREVEFTKPLTISLLTSRRVTEPFGLDGGDRGASGINLLKRLDGTEQELDSQCEVEVKPGDRIRIETPGGGGFGSV